MSSHILPHMVLVCPICFPHVSDFSRFSPRFSYMFAICFATFFPHGSHMYPFFLYFPKFSTPNFPRNCHICFPTVSLFFRYSPQVLPEMVPICFATFLPMFPTCFPSFNIFLQFFPYVSHMFPACFPDICFPTVFPQISYRFHILPQFFPIFFQIHRHFPTFFRGTDRAPLMVNIASTVAAACRARSSVRPKASKARPAWDVSVKKKVLEKNTPR